MACGLGSSLWCSRRASARPGPSRVRHWSTMGLIGPLAHGSGALCSRRCGFDWATTVTSLAGARLGLGSTQGSTARWARSALGSSRLGRMDSQPLVHQRRRSVSRRARHHGVAGPLGSNGRQSGSKGSPWVALVERSHGSGPSRGAASYPCCVVRFVRDTGERLARMPRTEML